MKRKSLSMAAAGVVLCGLLTGCASNSPLPWRVDLSRRLPTYGAQNWIIVADAAYPYVVSDSIEYIRADEKLVPTLDIILDTLVDSKYVLPTIYQCSELDRIPQRAAPSIDDHRRALGKRLKNFSVKRIPLAAIEEKTNEAAKQYHVLVVKADGNVPYSAVFIELRSRYWDATREKHLRDSIRLLGQ